jgi:hypothetical protein
LDLIASPEFISGEEVFESTMNNTVQPVKEKINTTNPSNITYQNDALSYTIKGFNINQLDSLKITLQING